MRGALAAWICTALPAAANECDRQPVRAASVQAIGSDMVVNGSAMAVRAVTFDAPADEVAREFRAYWKREELPSQALSGKRGLTMSALDGICQYVLEMPAGQNGAPSRGVMSVMRLDGSVHHAIPSSVAVLPGGAIRSDVESRDPDKVGRMWVIDLAGQAHGNASRYRDALARSGWTALAPQPGYEWSGTNAPKYGLAMQKGRYQLDAAFSAQRGGTAAVINVTESR
jgi:hypothetical protein